MTFEHKDITWVDKLTKKSYKVKINHHNWPIEFPHEDKDQINRFLDSFELMPEPTKSEPVQVPLSESNTEPPKPPIEKPKKPKKTK